MNSVSKKNMKQYLAGPYLIWMTGFTIIPLLLIAWYGLTDAGRRLHPGKYRRHRYTGALQGPVFISGALAVKHRNLPASGLSAGHDSQEKAHWKRKLYCIYLYPSHVDEFSSADSGLADAPREKWSDQRHLIHTGTAWNLNYQHSGGHCPGHGVITSLPFMVLPVYNVLCKN